MSNTDLLDKTYFPIAFDNNGDFVITNSGTAAAPCRLTVVPQDDIMRLEITGLSDQPIVVQKVKRNMILVIDGIDRTVTKDGSPAFEDYDAWEFPRLLPGENKISITNAATTGISIEYQPRYI